MNLDNFLLLIATPFLTILTGVFVYVAHKTNKIQVSNDIHEKQEAERFDYKEKSLSKIDNKIDDLNKFVATDLMGPINQVYQKINLIGLPANIANLEKCLTDIDFKPNAFGNDAFWMGIKVDDIKITFIVALTKNCDKLIFTSFSHSVSEITEDLMHKIFDYNLKSLIGNVGLKKVEDTNLVMVDYVLYLHDGHLPAKAIDEVIKSLSEIHIELFAEKYISISYIQIVFDDYIKLMLGAEKYKELMAGSEEIPKEEDKNN